MEPVKFDQLPYLCLKKIFGFLDLRDLARCRAVSRQFKYYVEQESTVDELAVFPGSRFTIDKPKYLTDRPIERASLISRKALESVRLWLPKLEKQVKFLHLCESTHSSFDFDSEFANRFQQLQYLRVDPMHEITTWTLTLPNLKVLNALHCVFGSYVLKTPKLEVLACSYICIAFIEVEHPETIKKIECDVTFGQGNGLEVFKNLQVLIFHDYSDSLSANELHLSNWKDLKELQLNTNPELDYEECQNSVVNLMRQITESKRELKLYLNGTLVEAD